MTDLKFDINDFRLDKDAKQNGVWVDFGGGASIKLANFDNPSFTDAFRKATKPYNDLGKKIPEDDQLEIMAKTMSRYIILDWKGIYDGDDELAYSPENAERLLKEIEWIRMRIIEEAKNLENFREKAREDTEGN